MDNINFTFNFVREIPQPEMANALTGDFSCMIFIACFFVVICSLFTIFRIKVKKFAIARHAKTTNFSNFNVKLFGSVFLAFLLVFSCFVTFTKAFAATNISSDQNIIATINDTTGDINFSNGILRNETTTSIAIAKTDCNLNAEFAEDEELLNSTFIVKSLNGVIYEGSPQCDTSYVVDDNVVSLNAGSSAEVTFEWKGLSAEKAISLIGSEVFSLKFYTADNKVVSLDSLKNELTYNGDIQFPYTIEGQPVEPVGYLFVDETFKEIVDVPSAKNAGSYMAHTILLPGFVWDDTSINYSKANDPKRTFNWEINQLEISVNWSDFTSSVYDGTDHYSQINAVINNKAKDTDNVETVIEVKSQGETTNIAKNAGTYNSSIANLQGSDASNYKIPESGLSKNYAIAKAEVKISNVTAEDKFYDGNDTATVHSENATLDGIVDGEEVGVTGITGKFAAKIAGTDTVNLIYGESFEFIGETAQNYSVDIEDSQATATATILQALVIISGITADNKTYDGNTNASIHLDAAVLTGVVEGETISIEGVTGHFASASAGTDTVNLTYEDSFKFIGETAANYTKDDTESQTTAQAIINRADANLQFSGTSEGNGFVCLSWMSSGASINMFEAGHGTSISSNNTDGGYNISYEPDKTSEVSKNAWETSGAAINGNNITIPSNAPAGTYFYDVKATISQTQNFSSSSSVATIKVVLNNDSDIKSLTINGSRYYPCIKGEVASETGDVVFFDRELNQISKGADNVYKMEELKDALYYKGTTKFKTIRAIDGVFWTQVYKLPSGQDSGYATELAEGEGSVKSMLNQGDSVFMIHELHAPSPSPYYGDWELYPNGPYLGSVYLSYGILYYPWAQGFCHESGEGYDAWGANCGDWNESREKYFVACLAIDVATKSVPILRDFN